MNCGLFNVPCRIWSAVEPFWFWVQLGFWVVVALLALWGLAKLKEIGGWPAVAGALGAAAYAFGWFRGRGGKPLVPRVDNVTELEDGPDVEPPRTVRKPRRKLFRNAPWNR